MRLREEFSANGEEVTVVLQDFEGNEIKIGPWNVDGFSYKGVQEYIDKRDAIISKPYVRVGLKKVELNDGEPVVIYNPIKDPLVVYSGFDDEYQKLLLCCIRSIAYLSRRREFKRYSF